MLISIDRIKVLDRIRKDYGDIDDLAQDIKENGLINPPVVTTDFKLIAGERRLRAMKHLGYQEVEVRVMNVKDYEHMLKLEINENENRKDFTRLERLEYARRLERIERVKAKDRQLATLKQGDKMPDTQNFGERGKGETTDKVAKAMGIGSGEQYRKEKYIAEHADKEILEAWDKGNISTHKAYRKIKELENQVAELRNENTQLKSKKPEIVEKEVVPDSIKEEMQKLKQEKEQLEERKKALEERLGSLDEQKAEVSNYRKQKNNLEREMSELMESMDILQRQYDKKYKNLSQQSYVLNKIRKATTPMKKLKGELEQIFKEKLEMSAVCRATIMSEIGSVYDFADFLSEQMKTVDVEVIFYGYDAGES